MKKGLRLDEKQSMLNEERNTVKIMKQRKTF